MDPFTSTPLPSHPAGSVPLDAENKQRLESAARDLQNQRQQPGDALSKWLLRMRDDINDTDKARRLALFRTMIKAHQYLDGNFFGYVDENCQWQTRQQKEGEIWYTDNQIFTYWRTALMELSRTQTEVIIEAPDGADDSLEAAAKFAKSRYDANRDRTFNARLKQTENAFALLNGITYRYTYPTFSNARKEQMPMLEQMEGEPDMQDVCANCGRPKVEMPSIGGTSKDSLQVDDERSETMPDDEGAETSSPADPTCHACGSTYFVSADVSDRPEVTIGYQDVPTCQNAWTVPNPVSVIVSLQASCIEETPFLLWKQLVLRGVLEEKFPGIHLPSTGVESTELRYITNQQKAIPAQASMGLNGSDTNDGSRELEVLEFPQCWLVYSLYCNKTFAEDQHLGNGKVLKANQKLGEMFPDGLYFASCGQIVLDIWNEDLKRKWTSSPYGLRPGSMYGSGSSIALSDQELLNDLKSLEMANAWANAVPIQIVDAELLDEISTDPAIPTVLKKSLEGPGTIDGRAIQNIAPPQLSAEVYEMGARAETTMQGKIGAFSNTAAGGLADSQQWGTTATALGIKREMAVGRFAPDLLLMADQLDREQAIQFLENEQDYYSPAQWKKLKGEYGDEALEAFLKCDIRNDLIVTIAPGSYMPKSDAQMQAKVMGYAQALPVLAATNNPELISYAAQTFGMPEFLATLTSNKAIAKRVIEKMEMLSEIYAQQTGADLQSTDLEDPQVKMVAQSINTHTGCPVDTFLDDHDALIEAYRDWRTTDEGRDASNACVAAVSLRVTMHQMAKAKQGQMDTTGAMIAHQPLEDAQNAQQQQAMAAQQQAAQQQQEAQQPQMIADAMHKVLELDDKEKQREHEASMAAMQAASEPQKHPMDHISESASYKDFPASVQRQAEQKMGFVPATEEETRNQMAANAPQPQQGAPAQ